jgi:hypothetical protein
VTGRLSCGPDGYFGDRILIEFDDHHSSMRYISGLPGAFRAQHSIAEALGKNDALQVSNISRLETRNTLVIPCISLTANSDDSAVDVGSPFPDKHSNRLLAPGDLSPRKPTEGWPFVCLNPSAMRRKSLSANASNGPLQTYSLVVLRVNNLNPERTPTRPLYAATRGVVLQQIAKWITNLNRCGICLGVQ